MKNRFLAVVLLLSLAACAQQKLAGVKRVDAFYQVQVPAMVSLEQRRRMGGNVADTAYLVYVQTRNAAPLWTKAWRNGSPYSVTAVEVKDSTIQVGFDGKSGKPIILSPEAGCKLYRLSLEKESMNAKSFVKSKNRNLLLVGKLAGKDVTYTVGKMVELQPSQYQ